MTVIDPDVLAIDAAAECLRIEAALRSIVSRHLRRQGAVVAVSGGVDSAVCAALAARALGPERVLGLLLPERDSATDSTLLGQRVCGAVGIAHQLEDITPALAALGCYQQRDEAVQKLFPAYGAGFRMKIALAGDRLNADSLNYFNLIIQAPDGTRAQQRMPANVYLRVVAATNMKQRVRKLFEYFHAERLNYAVIGTPNRLEFDLGFFVRGGDGLADVKPIAHLYKTQVYTLAHHLGLPDEVCSQPPTTDTYSLPQTQEEFYFALPYEQMDRLLYAQLHELPVDSVAATLGLSPIQVERAYRDIAGKQRAAARLHQAPLLVTAVDTEVVARPNETVN